MADEEETDRRRWLLLVMKAEKPTEAYEEIQESLEDAMARDDSVIEQHPARDWLRSTDG